MNTSLPTPETAPWILSKKVLDEAGLLGELHLLAPGAEHAHPSPAPGGRLIFVVAGSATVQSGRTNHVLQAEASLHLAPDTTCTVRNLDAAPAKVLVVDLPPPRVVRDPVLTTLLRG